MVKVVIIDDRDEITTLQGKGIVLYVHRPETEEECDSAGAVIGRGNLLEMLIGAAVNLGRVIEDKYDTPLMQGLIASAVSKALMDAIGNTTVVKSEGSMNINEKD